MKQDIILFLCTLSILASVFLFSTSAKSDAPSIVITEIGATEPSGDEWVEIYNASDAPIDLTGWKFLEANTNHGLTLVQGDDATIASGQYAVITQNNGQFLTKYPNITVPIFDSSWNTLNEGGEEIGLKNAQGDIIEQFTYINATNFSLERIDPTIQDYGATNWKEHPNGNTVGKQNYWRVNNEPADTNEPPIALFTISTSTTNVNTNILFDATSSTDDTSIASYIWDFGDETSGADAITPHEYTNAGSYTITLTVTDTDGLSSNTSTLITILQNEIQEETPTPTTSSSIRINEFVPNPNTDEHEWIELFNTTTSTAYLTGWTLHDGAGVIVSPTSTIDANGFIVIELSTNKLNNSGDLIALFNPENQSVDSVAYGNWENATVDVPEKGNALAIDERGTWQKTTTPTKGEKNSITAPTPTETPAPSSGGGGGNIIVPTKTYEEGVVVINELVSDPQDGEEEFVELFNTSDESISLKGWWVEDGSEAKTTLNGDINAHGFFVVDSPKGNLNNSGDEVFLIDPGGKEIDRVTYGNWDDGNTSDNAPIAQDPLSLARRLDGLDANNDFYDFVLTDTITKGKTNIISLNTTDGTGTGQILGTKIFSSSVHINEIYPNPPGSDSDDEFIELYNAGAETVDITNWKLGDSSKKRYTITDGHLTPGAYLVLKRATTGIALNNSGGEEVGLYDPNGAMVEKTHFTGSAAEGQSWARKEDGSWAWTTEVTPSEANVIEGKSAAPIIAITVDPEVAVGQHVLFDASDTTDPESETITFVWTFGDNSTDEGDIVEHVFNTEGTYTVTLAATDASGNTSSKEVIVSVKNTLSFAGGFKATTPVDKIEISEIFPNPQGSDTTEFIELYNPTDTAIDLTDIKLDDEEGGSRAYTIPKDTTIAPGAYMVFGRQDTKLALNNTSDSARILYPDGTVLRDVRFDDVLEGHSYVRDENDEWTWTSTLTPGEANIVSPPDDTKKTKTTTTKSKMVKPVIATTLAGLRNEDIGDMITTTGTVAVLPDVFGSQYFYMVAAATSTDTEPAGVQVYMNSKAFPDMDLGDVIQVTGEISEISGETRVKTSGEQDIKVLDHEALPNAKPVDIATINETYEGSLIEVHGEITEIKSSYMYVDDGSDEIQVYFKRGAGINPKTYQLGDLVNVEGIVSQTKSGYRLLPRTATDIVKTGVVEDVIVKKEATKEENTKELTQKYLTATAGGITAILVGLVAKIENSPFKKIILFFRRKRKEE
ncbi:MAG: hypothetical protein COU32_01155 [Candidatus Magasanikbacteria bacterium CG10_big_fil_rev_8_21_14_0_10_42_10]|uniref:PKD domain-containing protein n=2 Tax=Candidatus Magasanikiibacteriota TaxID=1752731 RepID=A0A2H0TWT8_9BACT|nr:MAG: hypothetical protein COU32_01155 [Candidatus Magasanikbacteria bacterium CG10_big_fil_rev_8_21_14_0_10_42_10]PIZ93955.1 MAG: hypothetical protein COX82_01675 [Candidatus Magasanikbacteria bacterium CG_4_10_14_0_2_um_filter_41_10]